MSGEAAPCAASETCDATARADPFDRVSRAESWNCVVVAKHTRRRSSLLTRSGSWPLESGLSRVGAMEVRCPSLRVIAVHRPPERQHLKLRVPRVAPGRTHITRSESAVERPQMSLLGLRSLDVDQAGDDAPCDKVRLAGRAASQHVSPRRLRLCHEHWWPQAWLFSSSFATVGPDSLLLLSVLVRVCQIAAAASAAQAEPTGVGAGSDECRRDRMAWSPRQPVSRAARARTGQPS